jgi:non-heme chloroperoxidase
MVPMFRRKIRRSFPGTILNQHRENAMTTQLTTNLTTSRSHRIQGGGGTEIYAAETGNQSGRPMLFIHGISQSRLSWRNQMSSDLGNDLRLVAMDLRGHGGSARPHDAYGDSAVWADDVHAVITALGLERPILCGWSYGGVVIGDYLHTYGEQALGGIVLVAAVSRLGEPVVPFLSPEFLAVIPDLFATDVDVSTAALNRFVSIATAGDADPEDFYLALGYNTDVPPHVRQAMLSRTVDHDDLLARLRLPTLIVHGLEDQIVLPAMSEHHAGLVPHARVDFLPGVGHSPFAEEANRFNAALAAFASSL